MIKNTVNCVLLFLLLLTGNRPTIAENVNIAVRDTVYHRIRDTASLLRNAAQLTSGIYFIHLGTNTARQTIKAVLIK